MATWKMPPRAKVYEALTAVADGRVRMISESEAEVTSSGGDKVYKVKWDLATNEITSSDPASRFQGYIGYPIIAVLLLTGRLPFHSATAQLLSGVAWKKLNDEYRRDYDAAVDLVLSKLGADAQTVRRLVGSVYSELERLGLQRPG